MEKDDAEMWTQGWTQGVLRVRYEPRPGFHEFGTFLGLLVVECGDTDAVVRLDGWGLMLVSCHPSRLQPVTPEEEELYKP
jgi:hypothetical protein